MRGGGVAGVKIRSIAVRSSDGSVGIGYSCLLACASALPAAPRVTAEAGDQRDDERGAIAPLPVRHWPSLIADR